MTTTTPDGKPYKHNAEQSEAAKYYAAIKARSSLARRLLRHLYHGRYGFRGGIKPPLGPPWGERKTLWYRWQFLMWKAESKIYRWTGLPGEWHSFLASPYLRTGKDAHQ